MAHDKQQDWMREFRDLGPDQVRKDLLGRGWEPDKRSAARQWLENQDAIAWGAKHPEGSGRRSIKDSKWWMYVGGGVLVVFGVLRLWKFL